MKVLIIFISYTLLFSVRSFALNEESVIINSPIARIVSLKGKAILKDSFGRGSFLLAGSTISKGDTIFVDKGSFLKVWVKDESILELGAQSVLEFRENRGSGKESVTDLLLSKGPLKILSAQGTGKVRLNTPLSTFKLIHPVEVSLAVFHGSNKKNPLEESFFLSYGKAFLKEMKLKENELFHQLYKGEQRVSLVKKAPGFYQDRLRKEGIFLSSLTELKQNYDFTVPFKFIEKELEEEKTYLAEIRDRRNEEVGRAPASAEEVLDVIKIHESVYDAAIIAAERVAFFWAEKTANEVAKKVAKEVSNEVALLVVGKVGQKEAFRVARRKIQRAAESAAKGQRLLSSLDEEEELIRLAAYELALVSVKGEAKKVSFEYGRAEAYKEASKKAFEVSYDEAYLEAKERSYEKAYLAAHKAAYKVIDDFKLKDGPGVDQFLKVLAKRVSQNYSKAAAKKASSKYSKISARRASLSVARNLSTIIAERVSVAAGRKASLLAIKIFRNDQSRLLASEGARYKEKYVEQGLDREIRSRRLRSNRKRVQN